MTLPQRLKARHVPAHDRAIAMANYERRAALAKHREALAKQRQAKGMESGPASTAAAEIPVETAPKPPKPPSRKQLRELRFSGLVAAYTAGIEASESEMTVARAVAGMTLQLEDMQAAMIRGRPLSSADKRVFTRLTNTSARLLRQLREKAKPVARGDAPSVPTLGEHLARLSQRKSLNGLANSLPN
jgi:hypothetical protein